MAPLDENVAKILDHRTTGTIADEDGDEDALIAELEDSDNDEAFSALRERRLEQLHAELSRAKTMRENAGSGTYQQIRAEQELLTITTNKTAPRCVVHFMKPDFGRCRIMDEKLGVLAEKHFDTRFVRMNVDDAPFLVTKLGIQVLPCVIAFIDGVGADRIIGFEGIGYRPDVFTVSELEARLLKSGVLVRSKMTRDDDRRRLEAEKNDEPIDDDDWD